MKVGAFKSLSIGFGKKIFHNNSRLNDDFYGEWEIGTYYCSWRVLRNKIILCASNDSENGDELNIALNTINFGSIVSIKNLSAIDVRVTFDTGIHVDFLSTIKEDDECFHIFCPGNKYIELSTGGKWLEGTRRK